MLEDVTADFIYLRLHGDKELYASGYGDAALDRWAERIRAWRRGGEPRDARRASATPRAPRRARATCTAISTTTSRCGRRSTRIALMRKLGLPAWKDAPDGAATRRLDDRGR